MRYTLSSNKKRRGGKLSVDAPTNEIMALAAHGKDMGRQHRVSQEKYYCSFCKMPAHSNERCFKANHNWPTCTKCQMPGHTIDKCFKIHGYPPGHKLHGKNRDNECFANQTTALLSSRQEQLTITKCL